MISKERLRCSRCRRIYREPPKRDWWDGEWYCDCGGSVELERENIIECESCGRDINRYHANEGDYGELLCEDCYSIYLSELRSELVDICHINNAS